MEKRGSETIRVMGKLFRQMYSYDGNRKISRDEFLLGLREVGINPSKQENDVLLPFFDKNNDGMVDFEEFLIGIRGKPNLRRQSIIDKAFLRFDKEGTGFISVKEVRYIFLII
jgi:Ca2+-binding EF-hand superfamily protein